MRTRPHQQARPRHRREGYGDLQLGIVAAAGARVSVRPAVVEDVLPLAVGLDVERCDGERRAARILDHQVLGQPAGLAPDRARLFQRIEKGMADKGILRHIGARIAGGTSVPLGCRDALDGIDHARGEGGNGPVHICIVRSPPAGSSEVDSRIDVR
jgi:hypothetical protein